MHKGPTALTGSDKDFLTDLADRLASVERYVFHLVSLLPEGQRVPKADPDESEVVVVSTAQALRDDAVSALVAENKRLKAKALAKPKPKPKAKSLPKPAVATFEHLKDPDDAAWDKKDD